MVDDHPGRFRASLATLAQIDHNAGECGCQVCAFTGDRWFCEAAPETVEYMAATAAKREAFKARIAADRAAGRLWLGGRQYVPYDYTSRPGMVFDRRTGPAFTMTEPWWTDPPDLDNLPEMPEPLVVTTDGRPILPREGLTVIYGGMSSGKSWIGCAVSAVTAAHPGARVAYVDFEMHPITVFKRLRLLGAYKSPGVGVCGDIDQFRYASGSDIAEPEQRDSLRQWLTEATGPALVVIDSIGAAGGHTNDAAEYISWHNHVIRPFIEAGVAVLGIDHDIRSKSGQKDRVQHGGIGSAAKGNEADLVYQLTAASWTSKRSGSTTMILRKDRHAIHGDTARDTVCARFEITYDQHGGLGWDFRNAEGMDPTPTGAPSQKIADRIRADIEEQLGRTPQGTTKRQTRKLVTGKAAHIDYILDEMVADGTLHHDGDTYHHHGYTTSQDDT